MASKGQDENLTEEVICPICLDFFIDPVILECGHNFCRSCITRFWEREERNSCPECRAQFADRTLRSSRLLARLAEKARKLHLKPKENEIKRHCEEHEEEMKLFCETDKKMICVICKCAQEHRGHRFLSIKEAVEIYKDQVKSSIESLTKKKSDFQQTEKQQIQKISGVREQSRHVQSHITAHFVELHQILAEKKQHFLRDLREEEERILNPMEKNLREIQENLNSIQEEISTLRARMNLTDSVRFLKEEVHQKRSVSDETPMLSVTDGALTLEKFNNLFSLETLLKETYIAIKQVSVTLDVETAGPGLVVSEDRKKVKWTRSTPDLPDTGKRFTVGDYVLGSEGFTSGRHYWEVDVAGNRRWRLGVAAESVERKRGVKLKTDNGFWTIWRQNDEINVNTSPPSCLTASSIPGRVGIYLSYESGRVSFYNAENRSHLHTFTGNKFTGKLYPFFGTVDENEWVRICSVPLQICTREGSGHRRQMPGSGSVKNLAVTRLVLKGSLLIPKFRTVVIQ
ncbi:zinc-binding protein A33-like [Hypanus sabinus]|uniref:zinc-binding protein A33-like n=1 Tax=Hypanus sabinus TaxID=79690 RepID=UPI0028C39464|nr:zinc-binding protein A33-like [Hypanus sabinus]XP_059816552.1 zinc-binding protein A33-like [Hypanus sabinus]